MNHFRLYPSVKHMHRFLSKPCFYSPSSINRGNINDKKGSSVRENIKEISLVNPFNDKRRVSLIQPRSSKSLCNGRGAETKNAVTESSFENLGSGMILMRNYISLRDQVEIVNLCQKLSFKPCAFEAHRSNAEKIGFHTMLLGRRWHINHDSWTITVPDKFISLVNSSIQDCESHLNTKDKNISVCSNSCVLKFYTDTGRLNLHQVLEDDLWWSPIKKGWAVVSMFIGDSAEFFCSYQRNVNEPVKVWLESGDVLICSTKSRCISLGLHRIIPNSAPLPLLEESMLKPGVLSLSFRRF